MNKKISRFIIIFILIILITYMLTNSKDVIESVSFSISIWKDNLFPTLFPFFVVSNLLIQYGFIDIISNILDKPMQKIFKLSGTCSYVLITSLFSGFPSGAKYTKDLIKNNLISIEDANKLITFTHYSNPIFIIGFIGNTIFNNKNIGLIILISHIISGLIIGIIFPTRKKIYNKVNTKKTSNYNIPIGKSLTISIKDSLETMFLLLGIVTIFLIISNIINNIFNLDLITKTIISGLLEMTQGIKNLTNLEINTYFKTVLATLFISFGGLSVHMQVSTIISETNIKYKSFLIARIIHSLIAIGLVSILYYFIN